jgi:hypothetical protein
MRWEEERYVRFYTRDTPEFLALSWLARGLFGLILRKVDRAGILPLGKLGLRGVAVAVGGPWADVEAPLRELIDDGCVLFNEERHALVLPNFMTAQEAPQSDAARKRASRERARAEMGLASGNGAENAIAALEVTKRDLLKSQIVTNSHDRSHGVTSGHSDPCLAVPCRADPDPPLVPPQGGEPTPGARGAQPGVEAPPKVGKRKSRAKAESGPCPEGWEPSSTNLETGAKLGLTRERIREEAGRFQDHHRARGSAFVDWHAAFATWLRNEAKWARERVNGAGHVGLQRPASNGEFQWKPAKES